MNVRNRRWVAGTAMAAGLLLTLPGWTLSHAAGPEPTVRIGAYGNPPKISREPDGEIVGFWADLSRLIAEREGWSLEWVWGSWSDCMDSLASGGIDVMVDVAWSPVRARDFEFSSEPVLLSWSRLYVRQGDERIKTVPDLEGRHIGVLGNSINVDGPGGLRELVHSFAIDCVIVPFPDYDTAFLALEEGELDACATNRDFGYLKAPTYKVKATSIIFQPLGINFAFSPASVRTPQLKARIDTAISELKADPHSRYYDLLNRHFTTGTEERSRLPGWVQPALRTAVVIILVMLGGFIVAQLEIRRGRKKLEMAYGELETSEARYKEIFDSTGDAIFIHDGETGMLADVNRSALNMYKCTWEQALNLPPDRFCLGEPPYTPEEALAKLRVAARGERQVFEWKARALDGRIFWVEVALKATEFGGKRWVIATVRDIDERKRMEGDLIKTAKLHSLGVLAGGIAHDFNNLLTAIMGNTSMAIADLESGSPQRRMLEDVEAASRRAQTLTRQLLTFARGGDPVRKVTEIGTVSREAAEFVMRGSGAACSFTFDPDLWPADVDPGQIGQVIQNLVINARQATDDGGVIAVACTNEMLDGRPHVRITVSDDGPGFSEADLANAFDPYYTTKAEGSGLGLAICHSIITRHAGNISLEPSPAGGARIVCDLPASPRGVAAQTAPEGLSSRLGGEILVMDDDSLVRDMVARMLRHFGCLVRAVGEGSEAVEAYRQSLAEGRPFAAVIMDLTIPGGMGGREAVGEILALDPGARVVVTSGYSRDPILANYRDYGFCAAVVKPYRLAELNAALSAAIQPGPEPRA